MAGNVECPDMDVAGTRDPIEMDYIKEKQASGKSVHQLTHWYVRMIPKGVFVEGYRPQDKDGSFWRSTMISKRVTPHLVETGSGSLYVLLGDLSDTFSKLAGIDEQLCNYFKNGFPDDWQAFVDAYIGLNFAKKKKSRKSFDTFTPPRTRTKVKKKPPVKLPDKNITKTKTTKKTTDTAPTQAQGKAPRKSLPKDGPRVKALVKETPMSKGSPKVSAKSATKNQDSAKKAKQEGPKVEDVSYFDLPTTRSGRRKVPPLAWWANERILVIPKSQKPIIMEGTPDELKSTCPKLKLSHRDRLAQNRYLKKLSDVSRRSVKAKTVKRESKGASGDSSLVNSSKASSVLAVPLPDSSQSTIDTECEQTINNEQTTDEENSVKPVVLNVDDEIAESSTSVTRSRDKSSESTSSREKSSGKAKSRLVDINIVIDSPSEDSQSKHVIVKAEELSRVTKDTPQDGVGERGHNMRTRRSGDRIALLAERRKAHLNTFGQKTRVSSGKQSESDNCASESESVVIVDKHKSPSRSVEIINKQKPPSLVGKRKSASGSVEVVNKQKSAKASPVVVVNNDKSASASVQIIDKRKPMERKSSERKSTERKSLERKSTERKSSTERNSVEIPGRRRSSRISLAAENKDTAPSSSVEIIPKLNVDNVDSDKSTKASIANKERGSLGSSDDSSRRNSVRNTKGRFTRSPVRYQTNDNKRVSNSDALDHGDAKVVSRNDKAGSRNNKSDSIKTKSEVVDDDTDIESVVIVDKNDRNLNPPLSPEESDNRRSSERIAIRAAKRQSLTECSVSISPLCVSVSPLMIDLVKQMCESDISKISPRKTHKKTSSVTSGDSETGIADCVKLRRRSKESDTASVKSKDGVSKNKTTDVVSADDSLYTDNEVAPIMKPESLQNSVLELLSNRKRQLDKKRKSGRRTTCYAGASPKTTRNSEKQPNSNLREQPNTNLPRKIHETNEQSKGELSHRTPKSDKAPKESNEQSKKELLHKSQNESKDVATHTNNCNNDDDDLDFLSAKSPGYQPPKQAAKQSVNFKKMFDDLKNGPEPSSSSTAGPSKPLQLTGGVGTLKRKRELRELVEQHNAGHEDDLFDSTPFKKFKSAKTLNVQNDLYSPAFKTPMFKTPGLQYKHTSRLDAVVENTPTAPAIASPALLDESHRNKLDRYENRITKGMKKRGTLRLPQHARSHSATAAPVAQLWRTTGDKSPVNTEAFKLNNTAPHEQDPDEDVDYYFSDNDEQE